MLRTQISVPSRQNMPKSEFHCSSQYKDFLGLCHVLQQIEIWQVRFKLSRVAEAQFNTKTTEILSLLDVFLYYASKGHVLTFLSTGYYIIKQKLSTE